MSHIKMGPIKQFYQRDSFFVVMGIMVKVSNKKNKDALKSFILTLIVLKKNHFATPISDYQSIKLLDIMHTFKSTN